jgi:hypothetical protein
MRRAVDWSYEALNTAEQRLFERVGVFRGGFELDAAEGVCAGDGLDVAAIPDLLFELVSKSLVMPDTSGATTRYRQLETLREFAAERLSERGEGEAGSSPFGPLPNVRRARRGGEGRAVRAEMGRGPATRARQHARRVRALWRQATSTPPCAST